MSKKHRRVEIARSFIPLAREVLTTAVEIRTRYDRWESPKTWAWWVIPLGLGSWWFDWQAGLYIIFGGYGVFFLFWMVEMAKADAMDFEWLKIEQQWNATGLCECCLRDMERRITKEANREEGFDDEGEWDTNLWEHIERDAEIDEKAD